MQLLKLCSVRRSDVSAHGENVKQRLSGNFSEGYKRTKCSVPIQAIASARSYIWSLIGQIIWPWPISVASTRVRRNFSGNGRRVVHLTFYLFLISSRMLQYSMGCPSHTGIIAVNYELFGWTSPDTNCFHCRYVYAFTSIHGEFFIALPPGRLSDLHPPLVFLTLLVFALISPSDRCPNNTEKLCMYNLALRTIHAPYTA